MRTPTITDPRIMWAIDHMQRRLGQRVEPDALAHQVNLSTSHFRHLFAAQAGLGPVRYLERLRMQRARVLIERTFLTVPYVMALVGYDDPRHFVRDFGRLHGVRPDHLRTAGAATPLPAAQKPATSHRSGTGKSSQRQTRKRGGRAKTRDPASAPSELDANVLDEAYCLTTHTARPSAAMTFSRWPLGTGGA
jgi:AraC-like DNA-binding protein